MTTQFVTTFSVTNLTPAQLEAITKLLSDENEVSATTKKPRARPAKTVNEDEGEEFATKALESIDFEDEEDETDEETDEDEDTVTWEMLKASIDKYGTQHPDEMKAVLAGFNFKNTKELKASPKKYEAVYRKVLGKLKALRRA